MMKFMQKHKFTKDARRCECRGRSGIHVEIQGHIINQRILVNKKNHNFSSIETDDGARNGSEFHVVDKTQMIETPSDKTAKREPTWTHVEGLKCI